VCKQITEKQIKQAISNGASSIEAIRETLGAASECGSCLDCVKDIITECSIPVESIKIIDPTKSVTFGPSIGSSISTLNQNI